jgi:hypothetical protein
MLWLRTILPVIGNILSRIKELNKVVSFIRFVRQTNLDCSDILGDLRTSTTRQRYWRDQLDRVRLEMEIGQEIISPSIG